MMTGTRLVALAGGSGRAGVLLLQIGTGATAGAALQNFSRLPNGVAAYIHLLQDRAAPVRPPLISERPGSALPVTRGVMRVTAAQVWKDRYYRTR